MNWNRIATMNSPSTRPASCSTTLNPFRPGRFLSVLGTIALLWESPALRAAEEAAPKTPPVTRSVYTSSSTDAPSPDHYRYSLEFTGGSPHRFFQLWNQSGFTNDTVMFAGVAEHNVPISNFKVKSISLSELAKSLEFASEGALQVEAIPQKDNVIWRIRPAQGTDQSRRKSRACPLPAVLSSPDGKARIASAENTLINAFYHADGVPPRGTSTIMDSEKIVVLIGSDAYIDGMTSLLEAMEKTEAAKAVKPKSQE